MIALTDFETSVIVLAYPGLAASRTGLICSATAVLPCRPCGMSHPVDLSCGRDARALIDLALNTVPAVAGLEAVRCQTLDEQTAADEIGGR